MAWSEDAIHRWLARRPVPRVLRGSRGHDAAVLAVPRGREVCCVDQTIEGVHFEPLTSPARVGAKAASRALSDLAATAAEPRAVLLALSAPRATPESWLRAAIGAVARRAEEFGAELVAGDLSAAPGPRALSVTALGVLPGRKRPPGRDRVRGGDVVFVTGPVGGSRAGRHLRLVPRVAVGRALFAAGVRALMDVSDGLALDLWRMARASGVRIRLEHVPVHRDARRAARVDGRSATWHALHDGEDHELLGSITPRLWPRLAERHDLIRLGRAETGRGLVLDAGVLDARGGTWTPERGGWLHGR